MNWFEKVKKTNELNIANQALVFQINEREKRAAELLIANNELIYQNEEKEKRAAELILANIELTFQNKEKEKRAAELIIANKELVFQHEEKEKRAIELLNANSELKKAEEQFRLVVESSPNALLLIDSSGIIMLVNSQTENLFGYTRTELIGEKLEVLIPERFRAHHPGHRNAFFHKPQMRPMESGPDLFALKKDNSEIQVEIGLNPIETLKGQMVLASIIDITERKLQEAILKKHNKDLLFQNAEKEKRAAELIIANKELVFQHQEKEKRAAELIIANKELDFQNNEKEKRATELIIANIQKEEIKKSKLAIEEKNKSITDSIRYAKRIQLAKLPKKEEIYTSLKQCFVLFKPKDIVSGDFYYFHKNEKSIFLVAADCTGHGVPGAFMSMICSEKLDDAIANSSDTSEILKHLNKGIKTSLHQTENSDSTKDGMDIAICEIDIENRIVKYSGANRPLWIIRNGELILQEIKPTKKAIGGFTDYDQHFENHELKLNAGDTIYISTDGYADQFGGHAGKKLMTRLFKKILLEIQEKPMNEQEKHLDNFMEKWKDGFEQVDDILVIGVRL